MFGALSAFVSTTGPYLVAAALAAVMSGAELAASKYPRTFFVLRTQRLFHAYMVIYAVAAAVVLLLFASLVKQGSLKVQTPLDISNPWVQALIVGFSVKALLHIRIAAVTTSPGAVPFPLGLETIVAVFEPNLLDGLELAEFSAVHRYIKPRLDHWSKQGDVVQTILDDLPHSLPTAVGKGFSIDVKAAQNSMIAMELYLRSFGKKNFDRLFPV